jgi:hypothetical protein
MMELGKTVKRIIDDCGNLIQEVWHKLVSKYGKAFEKGEQENTLVKSYKKLEWFARERDKIKQMQEKLKSGTTRLSVLVAAAAQ